MISAIYNMNWPQVYIRPFPLAPPSHFPPPPTPLGCHRAPALGSQSHIAHSQKFPFPYFTYSNVYVSVLFSQTIPPSPSPMVSKICSLCLCLFCCPASTIISTIVLDSIYVCQYMIFVFLFLTYFTVYNRL